MRTFGGYHELYLKTDILLLANLVENFRYMSRQYYDLKPCNIYTADSHVSNAMLKMTDIRIVNSRDIVEFQSHCRHISNLHLRHLPTTTIRHVYVIHISPSTCSLHTATSMQDIMYSYVSFMTSGCGTRYFFQYRCEGSRHNICTKITNIYFV